MLVHEYVVQYYIMLKPRHKKFLDALPKHNNKIAPSAVEAGYSQSYANKRGKKLYQTALKEQAKDIVRQIENTPLSNREVKEMMSDIVGLDKGTIMERIRFIATQDKDLGTALKVLAVLASEHGVSLDSSESRVVVPVLNIVVDKPVNNVALDTHETLDVLE